MSACSERPHNNTQRFKIRFHVHKTFKLKKFDFVHLYSFNWRYINSNWNVEMEHNLCDVQFSLKWSLITEFP